MQINKKIIFFIYLFIIYLFVYPLIICLFIYLFIYLLHLCKRLAVIDFHNRKAYVRYRSERYSYLWGMHLIYYLK